MPRLVTRLAPWLAVLAATGMPGVVRAEPVSGADLIAGAKGLRIERKRWNDVTQSPVTAASGRVTADWVQRLRAAALEDAHRLPEGQCYVTCGRCPDQLLVDLSFSSGGEEQFLSLRPREGLAMLRSRHTAAWSFADSIAEVVALMREAFPKDPVVQTWAGSATAQPQPEPDSAASRFDDLLVTALQEVIQKVPPSYPERARQLKISGLVLVHALVGPDGSVAEAMPQQGPPELETAAVDAVRAWRFKPAHCGERPVAVWVTVPVRFSLH